MALVVGRYARDSRAKAQNVVTKAEIASQNKQNRNVDEEIADPICKFDDQTVAMCNSYGAKWFPGRFAKLYDASAAQWRKHHKEIVKQLGDWAKHVTSKKLRDVVCGPLDEQLRKEKLLYADLAAGRKI